MKKIFTSLLCGLMTTAAFAQWSPTSMQGEKIRTTSNVTSYYSLDLAAMRSTPVSYTHLDVYKRQFIFGKNKRVTTRTRCFVFKNRFYRKTR